MRFILEDSCTSTGSLRIRPVSRALTNRSVTGALESALMRPVLLLLALCLACGGDVPNPVHPISPEPAYATILSPQIERLRQELGVPGLVVLVRSRALGDWTQAFGTRVVDGREPVRTTDPWRIASCTKTMTATVVLQLIAEGRLRLEDPIADYLPGVPNGEAITLRQLLTMRSGLFNYTDSESWARAQDADLQRVWRPEELLAFAFAEPPLFEPGQDYHYSNTNTVLLGLVAERLTGRPLARLFRERLFGPLGLEHTLLPSGSSLGKPHPRGYMFGTIAGKEPDVLRDVTDLDPSFAWAAGGALSTAEELAVWVRALVEGDLLPEALQQQRLTDLEPVAGGTSYGLGIMRFGQFYGHSGTIPGFNTLMGHDPQNDLTFVVWCSLTSSQDGRNPADAIATLILQEFDREAPLPVGEGPLQ